MKNPTYTQFMNEVNNFIAKLSKDQLKEVITGLAENSPASNRNNFLHVFENTISPKKLSENTDIELSLTPDEFQEQIQDYYDRMKEGEFYDEEKDYDAYHRSERQYWADYGHYDDEPEDYSSEDSVFLYYYNNAKEEGLPKGDLLQLLLDGIKIIPEKYKSRSYLSLDLIGFAKKEKDRKNLLLGYSTAFYSHKSRKNLAYFLDFIISEKKDKEIKKLKNYFEGIDVKELQSNRYYFTEISGCDAIFSLDSSEIEPVTLIVGKYILNGIDPILNFIDTKNYKGFSDKLRYIAATVSLALKTIAGSERTVLIDLLLDYYCLDKSSEEYSILKNMVNNTAEESSGKENEALLKKLKEIKKISISRVSYILDNKYRKGYERGCLLLTACTEALQIISSDGDALISQIDTEFKRYSAFRSYLKKFTAKSSLLKSI